MIRHINRENGPVGIGEFLAPERGNGGWRFALGKCYCTLKLANALSMSGMHCHVNSRGVPH